MRKITSSLMLQCILLDFDLEFVSEDISREVNELLGKSVDPASLQCSLSLSSVREQLRSIETKKKGVKFSVKKCGRRSARFSSSKSQRSSVQTKLLMKKQRHTELSMIVPLLIKWAALDELLQESFEVALENDEDARVRVHRARKRLKCRKQSARLRSGRAKRRLEAKAAQEEIELLADLDDDEDSEDLSDDRIDSDGWRAKTTKMTKFYDAMDCSPHVPAAGAFEVMRARLRVPLPVSLVSIIYM